MVSISALNPLHLALLLKNGRMTKTHLLLMDSRMAKTHTATVMMFGFMGLFLAAGSTLAVSKQDYKRPSEIAAPRLSSLM